MWSGSEAGSYSRLIDFVQHSTLGLRVIHKKKKNLSENASLPHFLHVPLHIVDHLSCSGFRVQGAGF